MAEIAKKPNAFIGKPIGAVEQLKTIQAERHLSDADVDQLGIRIVQTQDTKDELGWAEIAPLISIPYWGITGEKLLDNRGQQMVRYRRTILNNKGERYTQRRGTGSRHYLPKLSTIDWPQIAKDPDVEVYYTEGEFKAIAACKHLGPCIGNAGVTSWRGPDGTLAAPLNDFVWEGRKITFVYDAEASSTATVPLKANIAKALGELAVELQMRGAVVKSLLIARTYLFKEGTKMGVDDYFNTPGASKEELLATAEVPELDEDWLRMFTDYAIYQGSKPHIKQIVGAGSIWSPKEFRELIERKTRVVDNKNVKIADIYRDSDKANTFNAYVFDPSLPPGYLRKQGKFNTWQGFEYEPERTDNYDIDIKNYITFTEGVWGMDGAAYFLQWAAHIFQRPSELTTISPILVSRVKGVGKSLTGAILRAIIGTKGSFVGSIEGLTEKHTGELEGKLFVQVDEADGLFAGKENRLKALDSDEIRIRKMNTDGYTVKNIMRKFYTTNENAAFRIAADERRYYVVRVNKTEEDGQPGAAWNTWLREVVVAQLLKSPEALGNIAWYLMNMDLSKWDPTAHVPRTEAMLDMVEAGESKKNVLADQMYATLSDGGMWATNSSITSVDNKLWGEIKAITKDKGGKVATHLFKDAGKPVRCHIYMPKGHTLETVSDEVTGLKLVGGQLTAEQCRSMLVNTKGVQDSLRSEIDGSKF